MSDNISGIKAGEITRDYFSRVHGLMAVWDFRTINTEFNQSAEVWIIKCSFIPFPNAQERINYEVEIEKDGAIRKVMLLEI